MTSILFAVGVLVVMALIVLLLFRPYDYGAGAVASADSAALEERSGKDSDDTRWRSVKIRPGLIACRFATDLQNQVFLSREAPVLPLPNCGERDCRCHYVFYDDRRSGIDRRTQLDRLGRLLNGRRDDRRRSPGRRATDLVPA